MVNKRIKLARLLLLVRRTAHRHRMTVVLVPDRGQGSHQLYVIVDREQKEVGRFIVTGHRRELSWTVLRSIENVLAPIFGDAWLEEK